MDRRLANERRAAIACRIGFERLIAEKNAGGSELMGRVLGLVSLWERQESCSPYYWERWRQLLAMPLEEAEAIVLADTDEGAQLRHAHPFAAVLTQADRRMLRRLRAPWRRGCNTHVSRACD